MVRQTQIDGYYVWEPQSKPLTILLNLSAIDRMNAGDSNEEIGGILLGRCEPVGAERFITTIDELKLVECDHQRGPNYALSEQDRKRFSKQLSRARAGKNNTLRPVGFFRTHRRPDLYLSAADIGLIQTYFPEPGSVALLVRPQPSPRGAFFFWEDGDLRRESHLQFPFDREQIINGDFTILRKPELKPVAATQTGRWPSGRWIWLWPVIAAIVVIAGLLEWREIQPLRFGAVKPPELGLDVQNAGNALRVRWNADAPGILDSSRGILWIWDGAQRRRMDLDKQQLAAGNVAYVPVAGDINFRLEVFHGDRASAESIWSVAPERMPIQVDSAGDNRTAQGESADRSSRKSKVARKGVRRRRRTD